MRALTRLGIIAAALLAGAYQATAQDQMLPVPTATIYPGDVIDASMLKDRAYPPNFRFRVSMIENPRSLIGKTVRRTLVPGEAIPANAVEDHRLVSRGVPTTIIFEEGGLSIIGVGTPLQNGVAGQIVQVKNMDSGRTIIGRVDAEGRIRIGVN